MPTSLLVIVTPDEQSKFLPAPVLAELRGYAAAFQLMDPTGLDTAGFARALAAADPEVVLACWRTPAFPAGSPFRGLTNVSLSPHIAGPTLDRYPDATALALRNLRAYAAGQPLEARITPEIFERSS